MVRDLPSPTGVMAFKLYLSCFRQQAAHRDLGNTQLTPHAQESNTTREAVKVRVAEPEQSTNKMEQWMTNLRDSPPLTKV